MRSFFVFFLLLLFSQAGYTAVTTFECHFPKAANKSKFITNDPMKLTFIIDSETKKAYMRGNVGVNEVMLVPNLSGITFVEITGSGNVMSTSIAKNGEAVHSRNTLLESGLVASQYYGKCKVTP